jgi:hypothetical protein
LGIEKLPFTFSSSFSFFPWWLWRTLFWHSSLSKQLEYTLMLSRVYPICPFARPPSFS